MVTSTDLVTMEVLYHHVDRIGQVPRVNEPFPSEEAGGTVLVIDRTAIVRGGRPVGWSVTARREPHGPHSAANRQSA